VKAVHRKPASQTRRGHERATGRSERLLGDGAHRVPTRADPGDTAPCAAGAEAPPGAREPPPPPAAACTAASKPIQGAEQCAVTRRHDDGAAGADRTTITAPPQPRPGCSLQPHSRRATATPGKVDTRDGPGG
jgi:hypothetical protein